MHITPVTTTVAVDVETVDHLLITAFDSNYGACHYWARDDSVDPSEERYDLTRLTFDAPLGEGIEDALVPGARAFFKDGTMIRLDAATFSEACSTVLSKFGHTLSASYLRHAIEEDDLGCLDAEAADVIVQIACFNDIIFG